MLRRVTGLWVPALALTLFVSAVGCDYTGFGSYQPPKDTPEDGDETSDGDITTDGDEPLVTGEGSCADPFVPVGTSATLVGEGNLDDLSNTVTGLGCLDDAEVGRLIVAIEDPPDGDLDDEEEAEVEAEAELEAEAEEDGDTDDEAEAEEDGDADDEAEAEEDGDAPDGDTPEDGDADDETETDDEIVEPRPVGNGPEAVLQVDLKVGDEVEITFGGESFDAILYVLADDCDDTAACMWPGQGFHDEKGVGEPETLSLVSSIDGTFFLVLDSKEADASGPYTYQVSVASSAEGTPPDPGKVGAPCVEKTHCDTNYCLTSQVLKTLLGAEIAIPNGYCSTIDLFVDDCSAACSEANGGFCIGGGFMGPDYTIVNLCLRPCETNGDCRIEDQQVCLDPQDWVDKGWLDVAVKEEYFGDYKACLPTAFIAVMEGELQGSGK